MFSQVNLSSLFRKEDELLALNVYAYVMKPVLFWVLTPLMFVS
jgi:hypothetical protein